MDVYRRGTCYLIETVTKYFLGQCSDITDTEIVLDRAAWIVDTGRYNEALKNGTAQEVEPCPGSVIITRSSIVVAQEWTKPLLCKVQ